MLCLKTALKIAASLPVCCVAALETTMDWASIILPITPPALLAAPISTALRPSCSAVTFCKLPNNAFDPAPRPGQTQPEYCVHSGVARDVSQPDHEADGQQRRDHLHDCLPEDSQRLAE